MKIKSVLFAIILAGSIIFVGCEGEAPMENDVNQSATTTIKENLIPSSESSSSENSTFENKNIEVGFNFEASLHRGRKWSEKHHVTPCTSSFGLCNVRVGPYIEVNVHMRYSNDYGFRLIFLEDTGAEEGDIFFSVEDDYFYFPSEIANEFGYDILAIIPNDYITHFTDEYPHGYVDIQCLTE